MATRSEWAERVDRWQKSGLSAEGFAAQEGINPKRLTWWRWKLQAGDPTLAPELRFLPVHVVNSAAGPPGSGVALEVALPNGRVVRIPPGFDPAMLDCVLSIASGGV